MVIAHDMQICNKWRQAAANGRLWPDKSWKVLNASLILELDESQRMPKRSREFFPLLKV